MFLLAGCGGLQKGELELSEGVLGLLSLRDLAIGRLPAASHYGISGTITGDPNSSDANNPATGLVFAGPMSPYDIFTSVVAEVGPNGAYTIPHLPAKTYFPFYVTDSNHDHLYAAFGRCGRAARAADHA